MPRNWATARWHQASGRKPKVEFMTDYYLLSQGSSHWGRFLYQGLSERLQCLGGKDNEVGIGCRGGINRKTVFRRNSSGIPLHSQAPTSCSTRLLLLEPWWSTDLPRWIIGFMQILAIIQADYCSLCLKAFIKWSTWTKPTRRSRGQQGEQVHLVGAWSGK